MAQAGRQPRRLGTGLPAAAVAGCVALLFAVWFLVADATERTQAVVGATAFSGIEAAWYGLSTEMADGTVRFTPGAPTCRRPHTTPHQWVANVLYLPVLLGGYRRVVGGAVARVLLFPLNVWLLEVVEGYAMMVAFGVNPAWTYYGSRAYFHGNVTLDHAPLWWALGAVVEAAFAAGLL